MGGIRAPVGGAISMMSAYENVEFGSEDRRRRRKGRSERVGKCLSPVGLAKRMDQALRALAVNSAQRVASQGNSTSRMWYLPMSPRPN